MEVIGFIIVIWLVCVLCEDDRNSSNSFEYKREYRPPEKKHFYEEINDWVKGMKPSMAIRMLVYTNTDYFRSGTEYCPCCGHDRGTIDMFGHCKRCNETLASFEFFTKEDMEDYKQEAEANRLYYCSPELFTY